MQASKNLDARLTGEPVHENGSKEEGQGARVSETSKGSEGGAGGGGEGIGGVGGRGGGDGGEGIGGVGGRGGGVEGIGGVGGRGDGVVCEGSGGRGKGSDSGITGSVSMDISHVTEPVKVWQQRRWEGYDAEFDGVVEEMIPADPMLAETHYSQYDDFETDESDSEEENVGVPSHVIIKQ